MDGLDLSQLDLLVIQIDGLHMDENLLMIGAVGVDADGGKHPLGVVEGATKNAATVQALLDNLIERGLDPQVCRLFIVDGAKALTRAIRRTFGADIPIQRCQVHKARNITDRIAPGLHAAVRRTLRQPGRSTMPPGPSVVCAIWHAVSNSRRRGCRRASLKGLTRS